MQMALVVSIILYSRDSAVELAATTTCHFLILVLETDYSCLPMLSVRFFDSRG